MAQGISENQVFDAGNSHYTREVGRTKAATANIHEPAANTAAVVTLAAGGAGISNCISGVAWSYAGTYGSGGNLKIEDGSGTKVFSVDIGAVGTSAYYFDPPLKGSANTALIATLAAAGASCTGKVSLLGAWTEAT